MREKRITVLVVEDDNHDYILLLQNFAMLDAQHYEVSRASSYEQAVVIIGMQCHDLYLLDYRLGRYDGIQLIHEIRRLGHQSPLVLMTGTGTIEVGAKALLAGATDFVPKGELHGPMLERTLRYAFVRQTVGEQMRTRANVDGLTKAMSREQFLEMARSELQRAQRFEHHTTLLIIDVDHFKGINDSLGHAAGDQVLRSIVAVLRGLLRSTDLVGRFGGDEFMVLMPETELAAAHIIAGRLCAEVARMAVTILGKPVGCNVSIGVAGAGPDSTALFDLIERADRGLYEAKRGGRNQVALGSETPAPVEGRSV